MMRLQKYLADCGIASRRKAEAIIGRGEVEVNGEVADIGTVIDENVDVVTYRGQKVKIRQDHVYIMLNKPVGYVSSTVKKEGASVLELITLRDRIYPVGRLDKDSSGLLLLTTDGDFAQEITKPNHEIQKEYFVVLDVPFDPVHQRKLEAGVMINGRRLKGVKITKVQGPRIQIILEEGMNRQIRRMLGKYGYRVEKLKRIRIGKLTLGDLEIGKWRRIEPSDVI
ncbi:MAG: rRNA pseudouridine synthase [Candidatus Buchananbacteria bacterium]|nr:rRNA pseudouridine synthase [Candidatus Buchananbacteria bacterium]